MSFIKSPGVDPDTISSGQLGKGPSIVLTADTYQTGIQAGRFCVAAAGLEIVSFAGTTVSKTAGVVLRSLAALLNTNTYDQGTFPTIEYIRTGLVTVDVLPGQSAPGLFDPITVENAPGDTGGLARGDGTGVEANAEFIREVGDLIWLVRLK